MRTELRGLVVAISAIALGCERPAKNAPPVPSSEIGRYQIVNGLPSMARDIMLLDTKTGRTWILCTTKDSTATTDSNWCSMKQFGYPASAP